MEKATEPKPDKPAGEGGGKRGSTKSKLGKDRQGCPPGQDFKATPASWFRFWWSIRMSPISAVTVSRLVTLLRILGIFISKRQLVRLLNTGKDEFLTEARDVTGYRAPIGSRWTTPAHATGPPTALHTDWQRPLHLVRHHGLQEPPQLP
jgi:hypothetical protein